MKLGAVDFCVEVNSVFFSETGLLGGMYCVLKLEC